MKATAQYIEAISTALTEQTNITIKAGSTWRTDIKKKEIEYNPMQLAELDHLTAKGLILHEVGHLKYTTDTPSSQLAKDKPAMQELYNCLEDIRIESQLTKDFGDFATEALADINYFGTLARIEQYRQVKPSKLEQAGLYIMAQAMQISPQDNFTQGCLSDRANSLQYATDADVRTKIPYDTLIKTVRFAQDQAKNTAEIKQYCDTVLYPLLKEYVDEASKQPEQTTGNCLKGKTQQNKPSETVTQATKPYTSLTIPEDSTLQLLLQPYINTLSQRLKDILLEHAVTRYSGAYDSGKLLSKNASKVITGEKKILSKRINPNIPHYVVTLVLDESGSMTGKNQEHTYIAAYLLQEVCKKLNFPLNLYSYHATTHKMDELKQYRLLRGGGTDDITAMQTVKDTTNKQDDNLVFVLTDGSGRNPSSIVQSMRKDNYIVSAIGLGLGESQQAYLKQCYGDTITAEKVEQLPQVMINQLQRIIHR